MGTTHSSSSQQSGVQPNLLPQNNSASWFFGQQGAPTPVTGEFGQPVMGPDGQPLMQAGQQTQGFGQDEFNTIQKMVGMGPNASDVSGAYSSNKNLASMLGQYAQSGGLPSQGDITQANGIATNLFAGQQAQLNNSFIDQNQQANRLAGQMGRSPNDPILQAKLRTGFMQQQNVLSAEEQAQGQGIAMGLPGQRLNYATQQNSIMSGLSNQAIQNQNFLMGLGNQLGSQARQYNLQTSPNFSNNQSSASASSLQNVGAGMGILGAGISAFNGIGNANAFQGYYNRQS